ncbi:reverse transcriptase domain protein [Colletotrichum abscissum]
MALQTNIDTFTADEGIILERTAPYTSAQNGPGERAGGVVFNDSRAMGIESNFPSDLWPEITAASVYAGNLTPRRKIHWKTPQGVLNTWLNANRGMNRPEKPSIAHLKRYGCRAYPLTKDYLASRQRTAKMTPRAHIGYLCGYDSTNIYRIWIPALQQVFRTRDVTFDETIVYDPAVESSPDDLELLRAQAGQLDLVDLNLDIDLTIEAVMSDSAYLGSITSPPAALASESRRARQSNSTKSCPDQQPYNYGSDGSDTSLDISTAGGVEATEPTTDSSSLINPSSSPDTTGGDRESDHISDNQNSHEEILDTIIVRTDSDTSQDEQEGHQASQNDQTERDLGQLPRGALETAEGSNEPLSSTPDVTSSNMSTNITRKRQQHDTAQGVDLANIIQAPRTRKPSRKAQDYNDSAYQKGYMAYITTNGSAYHSASLNHNNKRHKRDLPPPPRNWREAQRHPFFTDWKKACEAELQHHWNIGTWKKIKSSKVNTEQHFIIPLLWVFTYKFDKHGYLQKFKARICVQGNLQPPSDLDTSASTLAARTFRTMMALGARFGLRFWQKDAVNAFTNAWLDELVYVHYPPGFEEYGQVLLLLRALYGLRRSPLLWQRHITKTMKEIGFTQLQEDECVFIRNGILIFVFVDDIVIAFLPSKEDEARTLTNKLQSHYQLRDMGDLRWFLGIRIIRDLNARKIWLCLDSYIDSLVTKYKINPQGGWPQTPMSLEQLVQYNGQASKETINNYQRKVGSLNYAAVIGRPDISYTTSRLSEYLQNPGPDHIVAADRCMAYLARTKGLAIEYDGSAEGRLYCSSDAAFADDLNTRRSSQGYVTMLFGGPIDWKATKQKCVVTSSTEAELIALTQATREYIATLRLMKELEIQPDGFPTILCDNQQTLRLLTAEKPHRVSKLKHIDIQNLWARQVCQKGDINFHWMDTNHTIADGLTKPLNRVKHDDFVRSLRLVDITHLLGQEEE